MIFRTLPCLHMPCPFKAFRESKVIGGFGWRGLPCLALHWHAMPKLWPTPSHSSHALPYLGIAHHPMHSEKVSVGEAKDGLPCLALHWHAMPKLWPTPSHSSHALPYLGIAHHPMHSEKVSVGEAKDGLPRLALACRAHDVALTKPCVAFALACCGLALPCLAMRCIPTK